MIARQTQRRSAAFFLTIAALIISAQVILPKVLAQEPVGLLTVTGMVKVNGKPAATGDIVTSGSGVQTAAHSSAVVSLGKLGRVEALPETKMELRYDDTSITVALAAGQVRVSTGPGVSATIIRKEP